MNLKKIALYAGATVVILGAVAFAGARSIGMLASEPVYTASGVAVGGFDPVAYFTEGKPVKGDASISQEWNGARYVFASTANRDLFAQNPAHYAPQFGGYCAFAVAHGYTAKSDPQAWSVVGDKLYLNFDLDTQKDWLASRAEFVATGDKNWPSVLR